MYRRLQLHSLVVLFELGGNRLRVFRVVLAVESDAGFHKLHCRRTTAATAAATAAAGSGQASSSSLRLLLLLELLLPVLLLLRRRRLLLRWSTAAKPTIATTATAAEVAVAVASTGRKRITTTTTTATEPTVTTTGSTSTTAETSVAAAAAAGWFRRVRLLDRIRGKRDAVLGKVDELQRDRELLVVKHALLRKRFMYCKMSSRAGFGSCGRVAVGEGSVCSIYLRHARHVRN